MSGVLRKPEYQFGIVASINFRGLPESKKSSCATDTPENATNRGFQRRKEKRQSGKSKTQEIKTPPNGSKQMGRK